MTKITEEQLWEWVKNVCAMIENINKQEKL